MSNHLSPSFQSLPIEILHHIFDHFDAKTILFSIRPLSRYFRSIVQTYNRYVLDLNVISKYNTYYLCRLSHPSNITSLTLANDEQIFYQIHLFLSLASLQSFTRLHTLILLHIDENELHVVLKGINFHTVTSFAVTIRTYNDRREKSTAYLLSSVLAQSTLRKFELKLESRRMSQSSWPNNNCTLQDLTLHERIDLDYLHDILQCSSHLYALTLGDIPTMIIDKNITSMCFVQLTSLTLTQVHTSVFMIESFLLMTPLLIYLKVVHEEKIMDGQQWERFIRKHLCRLETFESDFRQKYFIEQTLFDLVDILTPFQTPFWTEQKKWFVTCETIKNDPQHVRLFSLPSPPSCTFTHDRSQSDLLLTASPTATITTVDQCLIII